MFISDISAPDQDAIDQLKAGLIAYNAPYTQGLADECISCFVRDDNNAIKGGVLAKIYWGWLYIEWFWLDESLRGTGVGSELLNKIENHALSLNVRHFRLETASFQALGFYKKNGYDVFGVLQDMPPGHQTYFLKKVAVT